MRYFRIFLLHAREVFVDRSRLLVWFLVGLISPLILILFWRGANNLGGWTIEEITSYYFLVITVRVFIMSHHEERIALIDIKEGGLTSYILKPFSYFWIRFFSEVSYRLVQGFFGFLLIFVIARLLPSYFVFANSVGAILLSILILILALFLVFIFKTMIGILAFWMTEARGTFEVVEVLLTLFAGYLMPLAFLPQWIQSFIYFTPFPYMIYLPVIAIEGKLSILQLFQVVGVQLVWITIFYLLYDKMWTAGIKKYTAVGQ
ncbi:ABC-2 family transporter protein [Candidatus Roizmanbacteria bacterium]|nr:ABC-2 family transporter protein [Candidatus Roizmanbacteria bacterium]